MLPNLNFFYFIIGVNPIIVYSSLGNLIWFGSRYRPTMCVINNLIDKAINYIWCLFDLDGIIHDSYDTVEIENPDGSVEVVSYG